MQTLESSQTLGTSRNLGSMQENLPLDSPPAASFAAGDFVWVKNKGHQWWPGRVRDPSEARDRARKNPPKDQSSVLVAFFGDNTFSWINPFQLKPFAVGFDQMASSSNSKKFRSALDLSLKEIGKCFETQLSCGCLPEEERSGLGKCLGRICNFEVGKFVGLVRDVAVDVSAVNSLDMVMLRSWVIGFERGLGMGHKRMAVSELVDKFDLDVPVVEEEGDVVLRGPHSNRGRKKRSMAVLIAQMDLDTVEVSEGEDDKKEENDNTGGGVKEQVVGSGRRERKKSKYLSPPYTHLSGGLARSLLTAKSSEGKVAKGSIEGLAEEEDGDITALLQVDGFDMGNVLSEFLATAVDASHLEQNSSSKIVRGLFTRFRRSKYAGEKQLAEAVGEDSKVVNGKELGYTSGEGKKTEQKRGRKKEDVANGEGNIPVDKSEEGQITEGRKGRKRKDIVECEAEAPFSKSEEVNETVTKRGRKKKDKVSGGGEIPVTVNNQTLDGNAINKGANGKTPLTPGVPIATDGTSACESRKKKAVTDLNISVSAGIETLSKVELGKARVEQTKGVKVNGQTMGKKAKDGTSATGLVVDVPISLGSKVANGSGESKSRKRKNNQILTRHGEPTAVLLTFSPETDLPSKEDLNSALIKYGPVIQSETELLKESSSAKVVFERTSDAEKAFNDKVAALGLPIASYCLRYLTGNLTSPSSQTPMPAAKPPLPYIRKSLERMISHLSGPALDKVVGTSEGMKPETRDNLVGEMQGLLMKVDKMLTGPPAGTSA